MKGFQSDCCPKFRPQLDHGFRRTPNMRLLEQQELNQMRAYPLAGMHLQEWCAFALPVSLYRFVPQRAVQKLRVKFLWREVLARHPPEDAVPRVASDVSVSSLELH